MTTVSYRDHHIEIFRSPNSGNLTVTINKITPPFLPIAADEQAARLMAQAYIDFVHEISEYHRSEMHASHDDVTSAD